MNISVSKDNEPLFQVDLAEQIKDNNGAELTFFVGRDGACQVVLEDQQVSREHAKIKYDQGSWTIEKMANFNTLSLNGSFCDASPLQNGDMVSIGPFNLNISLAQKINTNAEVNINRDSDSTNSVSGIDVGLGSDEATEFINEASLSDLAKDSNIEVSEDSAETEEQPEIEPEEGLLNDLVGDQTQEFDSEKELSEEDDFSNDLEQGNEDNLTDEFSKEGDGFTEGSDDFSGDQDEFDQGESFEGGFEVDEYDGDEKTQVIKSFASFKLDVFGEYAPYDTFKIEKPETVIGRDPEKCDIILNDPEVSSIHAIIKKNAITCTVEDQKSGNGTILNGERINSHELTNGDEFLIGSTTFTVSILSDFIDQEKDRIMPVEENQVVEVEEVIEVDENFDDELGEGDSLGDVSLENKSQSLFSKEALKDPQKRKKLLIYAVVLLGLWIMFEEEEKPEPPKPDKDAKAKDDNKNKSTNPKQKVLTQKEKEYVESHYLLAKQYFDEGSYDQTLQELDRIFAVTPDYKNAQQIRKLAKQGLEEITQLLEEKRKEKERRERELKVKQLLDKAREAVDERQIELSKSLFEEIIKLDPDNFDVTQLKLEIDNYVKEQERKAIEKAQKEAERKRQVQELSPGKTYYQTKEWYKAILKLQDFLKLENIDEDLVKEASRMLEESKRSLNAVVNPLLGKARSLKEGQDLKGAYENYLQILEFHPSHEEALNEMNEIREKLEQRSKKVYREAIIAESLSLYDNAKEKFQEVQQISPTDSEYYEKATEKLKEYLD